MDRICRTQLKFASLCARAYIDNNVAFMALFFALSATTSFVNAADSPTYLNPQTETRVEAIRNSKLQISLPAIDALSRSSDPAVIAPIADAYAHEKRALVRRYLVDALGTLRQSSALPTLQNALTDSDPQVRQSAVAALGLIGTVQAQAVLAAQASQEKDPAVKRHYAHQLQFSGLPEARRAMKTFRNDNDPAVKKIAARALDSNPEAK